MRVSDIDIKDIVLGTVVSYHLSSGIRYGFLFDTKQTPLGLWITIKWFDGGETADFQFNLTNISTSGE